MVELPKINSLLDVLVDPEVTLRSRVEDIDGDRLTIATPTGAGDVGLPERDSVLEVAWNANRGRFAMRVLLIGRTKEQPPRWFVKVIDPPALKNRRRFVRGGGGESIAVETAERDPAESWSGRVIDLSEGGVRCRITGTDLEPAEPVTIRIQLPDGPVELTGAVLALREPTESGAEGTDVVVVYDAPRAEGDRLRRYVLAWEIAERSRHHGRAARLVGALTKHGPRHELSRRRVGRSAR